MTQIPQFPANYPAEWEETATLRNGVPVKIRPIRPDDAPRLQHGFTHLSAESIYLRFLDTKTQLPDDQARELATLDYHERMALVGTILEAGEEHLIGVARYAMVGPEEPGAAELAIVVRDDYQSQGLGTLMFDRLIRYGVAHGVTALVGTIHQTNNRIMNFVRRSGFPYEREMIEPGVFRVLISLTGEGGPAEQPD